MQLELEGARISILNKMNEKKTNKIKIGTSSYCDFSMRDIYNGPESHLSVVSVEHFAIYRRGRVFEIKDLGSTNGTKVNDEPLAPNEKRVLRENDVIKLANMPQFQFKVQEGTDISLPSEKLGLYYDDVKKQFLVEGKLLNIQGKKFLLMKFLYKHAEEPCTYKKIIEAVWSSRSNTPKSRNNVQQQILGIRKVLGKDIAGHYIRQVPDGFMLTTRAINT